MKHFFSKYDTDILFLMLILAPTTSLFYYIMTVVIVFAIVRFRNDVKHYGRDLSHVKVLFTITIIVSLFSYLLGGAIISTQAIFRAFMLVLMVVCFPFVKPTHIHNTTIYICIGFTLLSQLCYVFHIPSAINFFTTYYPYESELRIYSQEYLLSAQGASLGSIFRLGGFMHNPNNCARTYSFIYALLLMNNNEWNFTSGWKNFLAAFMIVVGLLFCGSRTGMFVFVVLSCIKYIIHNDSKNRILTSVFAVLLLSVAYTLFSTILEDDSYRALQLGSGLNDSFAAKFNYLFDYLSHSNSWMDLLFGRFDQHTMRNYLTDAESLDAEIGISIFTYGIITTIVFIRFFYLIVKRLRKENILICGILLWMLSSSLLFSYRTSLAFLFILSICYSNSFCYYGRK